MLQGVLADATLHTPKRRKISPLLRATILSRDGFKCQAPGCKEPHPAHGQLELHHKNHDRADNRPCNLESVCHPCNMIARAEYMKARNRMHKLMSSLVTYKTRQLGFAFPEAK